VLAALVAWGLPAVTTAVALPAVAPAPLADIHTPGQAADSTRPGPHLSDADEGRARGLEARLKCPVCRTQSVLESTSFMALEMRAKIRELIAAGRSDGEILDYFSDRYGDYILLEPRKAGFALSAYLLPAVAVLGAGATLLAVLVRRRSVPVTAANEPETGASGPPIAGQVAADGPLSPADRARVEQELERYTV
jgi:cytochrome c-type biogenesis protein CcmH